MTNIENQDKPSKHQKLSLEEYFRLQYSVTLHPDPSGGILAEIKDLPGCLSYGESQEEALKNINDARKLWLRTTYEQGLDIPLPASAVQYNGKVLVRMPASLHRTLVEVAQEEGVSLNQYTVTLLSQNVAAQKAYQKVAQQMVDLQQSIQQASVLQKEIVELQKTLAETEAARKSLEQENSQLKHQLTNQSPIEARQVLVGLLQEISQKVKEEIRTQFQLEAKQVLVGLLQEISQKVKEEIRTQFQPLITNIPGNPFTSSGGSVAGYPYPVEVPVLWEATTARGVLGMSSPLEQSNWNVTSYSTTSYSIPDTSGTSNPFSNPETRAG